MGCRHGVAVAGMADLCLLIISTYALGLAHIHAPYCHQLANLVHDCNLAKR